MAASGKVKDGFIVSKLRFRDAQIHVEFAVSDEKKEGGWAGNRGGPVGATARRRPR